MASVAVTGQTSIGTSSYVEAWIRIQDATAEHTVDEHIIETLEISAGAIIAATGFTIYAEVRVGVATGTFNVNWCWS